MFNIDPSPEFTASVRLSLPGLAEPIAIQVTFRHKNRIEMAAWVLAAEAADAKGDDVALLNLLGEAIVDWRDLIDADGKRVSYDASSLAKLITNYTPARGELYRAYVAELTVAKRKN